MASGGAFQVTNREIIDAAGQKNTSALSYHFGNRDDLILAILASMGPVLDDQRGELSAHLDDESPSASVVEALVIPFGSCLHSEPGRHYVQIVDQLRMGYSGNTTGAPASERHLTRLLGILGQRPSGLAVPVRRERLIGMVSLMTSMVAERARSLEAGKTPKTTHDQFVDNLTAMLVGVIEAPVPTRL